MDLLEITCIGLLKNNYNQGLQGLFLTVILGIYFTALQAYEYIEASFRKILTYSSINHLGWILTAITIAENL